MRLFSPVALLIIAMTISPFSVYCQTCSQQVGAGTPEESFNTMFTQNGPGWTGGDSTYSIPLPDGRKLFFFSDSFIASSPIPNGAGVNPQTRTRTNPIFQAHNSLVVQNLDGSLSTISGGDSVSPTSLFVPLNTSDLYWMGDSTVVRNSDGNYKLIVYLLEFNASTYQFVGTSVATLLLPQLTIDSIQQLPTLAKVEWGSAVIQSSGHVFVYGIEDLPRGKYPHVARTTVAGLTDARTWEFWNGTDWVSDEASSARMIDSPDSISNEFNVNRIQGPAGSSYVLTTMDTSVPFGSWKNIVLYFSCSPQGPWSAKQVVYSTPETGTRDHSGLGVMLTYNPHAHFEYTAKGQLLISYDLNTTNGNDLIFADDYRPKFIRVPIVGLQ